MALAAFVVLIGLVILIWSADKFVDGAASIARHFGMPPLLIGMVIVGFGTSLPEMVVSAFSAIQGNPGIALGNAYGSNIANIGLILGVSALIVPITVDSKILRKELPTLAVVTVIAALQLIDGEISRFDAIVLLAIFAVLMGWTIVQGWRTREDAFGEEMEAELESGEMPLNRSILWVIVGIVLLAASSKMLVWGAVEIAEGLGVSELVIGLTVVAFGTSLPELASSVIAARKGEDDIALGNVLGSNLFNTLAVVGIAGSITPFEFGPVVLYRDVVVMSILTFSLFFFGYGFRGMGRIGRIKGAILLAAYLSYTGYLIYTVVPK